MKINFSEINTSSKKIFEKKISNLGKIKKKIIKNKKKKYSKLKFF